MLQIGGMTCAACSNTIEKTLKEMKGITEISVNLIRETAKYVNEEEGGGVDVFMYVYVIVCVSICVFMEMCVCVFCDYSVNIHFHFYLSSGKNPVLHMLVSFR